MKEVVLQAKKRAVIGKQVKAMRRAGQLPAVIYGRKVEPVAITLDYKEATTILSGISSSHLVTVDVEGAKYNALVREKQREPITGQIIHIDFQRVSMTEKLRVMVSLVLEGESPAVKFLSGVLVTGQEELEVECLPGDLVDRIVVNIAGLTQIGDSIHVRDLNIPSGVEVLSDPDDIVVVVTAPTVEVAPVEGLVGSAEPEVIEKGKKQEEDF
jgi:large subunit ribosomal protein L25